MTSVNSRKSRNNVLYPRRVHRPPVTTLLECTFSPDTLAWDVRYLCATLLPHSETRLLPAGIVLLKYLGQEWGLSQRKNEEIRHCSELFIVLTREIILKDAVGVVELEGPCKLLHLTFRDTFFKPRAFRVGDTPTTSNLNETNLRAPRAEAQGPERFADVVLALLFVMDVFKAALDMLRPPAVSDGAPRAHRHWDSPGFSVVRDLTMDQYREALDQKVAQALPLQSLLTSNMMEQQVAHSVPFRDGRLGESISIATRVRATYYDIVEPCDANATQQGTEVAKWGTPQAITTIEESSEAEDEWDFVDSDSGSCSNLTIRRRNFPLTLLRRFPSLSHVWVKQKRK